MSLYICQNTECTSRVNTNVNHGLWVVIMCQCRFISSSEGNALVGDLDSSGLCACGGREDMGNLYFLIHFVVNQKFLYKIQSTKKNKAGNYL